MSQAELSKAERHYFKPESVVEFGIPERCANCPGLNHKISMIATRKAMIGDPDESTHDGRYVAQIRQKEIDELVKKAGSCTGAESLTADEIDAFTANDKHEDDRGVPKTAIIGYRCAATGQIAVATTFAKGVVSLLSYTPPES